MTKRGFLRWTLIGSTTLAVSAAIIAAGVVGLSLPDEDGSHIVPGLSTKVVIEYDGHHIPIIHAQTRKDAYTALGYSTARDRLFQMDLSRRGASGRLAEVFGGFAAPLDIRMRTFGLERVAAKVVEDLSIEQRDLLAAYSAGVNEAISQMRILPVEFTILRYRPDRWRPEDSVLVLLALAARTSDGTIQERMASIMRRALPAEIVEFLSPNGNCYNERLAPHGPSRCSDTAPAPFDDLAQLLRTTPKNKTSGLIAAPEALQGSNAWVVGGRKSRDGRAIMANDMHLGLTAPGVFYRAELDYAGKHLRGITVPGVPLVVSGSNGLVAWGFTSVAGDFADLVRLQPTSDPTKYRSPEGELEFSTRRETINIRGDAAQEITIRETIWGPVATEKLLGDDVAIRWTILDPSATNFDLLNIDAVGDVREAVSLFHHVGGPPLNVLLADRSGAIAWTLMGKLPKRFGFDGEFSESWADGDKGWRGVFAPEEMPSIVDPPSGFLVNTNNRMPDIENFSAKIGHDFYGGFRAWRVTERLSEPMRFAERDMLTLQLDTGTEFYRYYQALALRVLKSQSENPRLSEIRRYIEAWDGRADVDSVGLLLIVEFRRGLVDAVMSPIVARCRELDGGFLYGWSGVDIPLRQIVESNREDLLPDRSAHRDWSSFIVSILEKSARGLAERNDVASVEGLTWGKMNKARVFHPIFGGLPLIGGIFNMPVTPLPGCIECVRYSAPGSGASARMVVSPGHEGDGILELSTGQSGQIGSPYYSDQQADWVAGLPTAFLAGDGVHELTLLPANARTEGGL